MATTKQKLEKSNVKNTLKHGGKRPGSGRKSFCPTESERKQVEALSGFGVPLEQIALLVRDSIGTDTLMKYFRTELDKGKAKANLKIGQTLFNKAVSGDTTAMIFWAKTQMRWSETQKIEHTSPDGTMTPKPILDVSKLSNQALNEILAAKDASF